MLMNILSTPSVPGNRIYLLIIVNNVCWYKSQYYTGDIKLFQNNNV